MDVIPRCIWLIVLIVAGAFFSGSETAYSYANAVRIRLLAEKKDRRAKHAVKVIDNFDLTLVTLLIMVNIIHILASTIATSLFIDLTNSTALGSILATIILTLAIFIFSETIPKNIAQKNADYFALSLGSIIRFFNILLFPFSWLLTKLGDITKKIFHLYDTEPTVTEDEFSALVEDASEDEIFEPNEEEIIQSAIEFGDIHVNEIMTKKEKICSISSKDSPEHIREILLSEKYSRFPVYRGSINNIIGILHTTTALWELTQNFEHFDIKHCMTKPIFCNINEDVSDVFQRMCNRKKHIAIVLDNNKTTGIITMEDILEEIIGEIYDEDEPTIEQEDDTDA